MDTTPFDSVPMNDAVSPQSKTGFHQFPMCDVYGDVVNDTLMGDGGCGPLDQPEPNKQAPGGAIDLVDLVECEVELEIPDRQLESFENDYSPPKYSSTMLKISKWM